MRSALICSANEARPERHDVCHPTSMIDDRSAIQQIVCRPGQGLCAIHPRLSPLLLTHAHVFSASESKNSRTASSAGHVNFRGPSTKSSQTSYLPYTRAKHHHFDNLLLRILPCRTDPPSNPSRRIISSQPSAHTHIRFPSCQRYHQQNPPCHVDHPSMFSISSPALRLPPCS